MGLEIFIPSKKTHDATSTSMDQLVSGAVGATIGVCSRGFQNVICKQANRSKWQDNIDFTNLTC